MKTVELNICSIKILTCSTDNKTQTLRFINIYNLYSLFIIFTEELLTISWLNELLKDNCEQLVMRNFNLHHSYWKDQRCFIYHTAINILLNIITNAKLKLLLKSDTITQKTHNQLMIINLVFNSVKLQFMMYKYKLRTDLHQRLNHFSIITKLCLCTVSMQFSTYQLWKKIEYRNIKCSFENIFFYKSLSEWQSRDKR